MKQEQRYPEGNAILAWLHKHNYICITDNDGHTFWAKENNTK
jgi:hypothetical protein